MTGHRARRRSGAADPGVRALTATREHRHTERDPRCRVVDMVALVASLVCVVSSATAWIAATQVQPLNGLARFSVAFTYTSGAVALVLIVVGYVLARRR